MAVPAIFEHLSGRMPDSAYKTVNMRGGFTSIDAYHILERLTDAFGLCGRGWGIEVEDFQHHDKCIAAVGHLWYRLPDDDTLYKVQAVGEGQQRGGSVADAMKMAQTNLMSKAASFLGIGLAIYKGQHLDAPLSVGIEVEEQPIRPGTLAAIEGATEIEIEAVTSGRKSAPDQLTEAEGKHLEAVLDFEVLVKRIDDGATRREKWLNAQGVEYPGEVSIGKVRQVIRSLREAISNDTHTTTDKGKNNA